ncbi:MAG TPA: hypothetical protein VG225_06900 [Terracidiphilus sp.]|jgi:hypothetical protein|nr:hypothetical protein [Terracidiphilus sp.]
MRFPVSFAASLAVAALLVCAGPGLSAQESSSQTQAQQTTTPQPSPAYISIDPLAGVRYDNRYDLSLGLAYDHLKAGPNLLQGANLGGLDVEGSYWLTRRWGAEGTVRGFAGTSGAAPNTFLDPNGHADSIQGPFVSQYIFAAGPEWLGPHNKHGALIPHVLVGGAYGDFQRDLRGQPTSLVDFYYNQVAPAMIMGGHFDLNRSPRWVFRITPDAILTDYAINYGARSRQIDINFGISVGLEYKFKKTR